MGFGRLSQLPRSAADIEAPSATSHYEHQTWIPYEDASVTSTSNAEQPARATLFSEQLSKLSELTSDMVNTFYAPRERFTSRRLATAYAQYQSWYQNLPDVFRLQNSSLPHVLVLHMYYYGCILHLFRPYIRLDLRGANLYPRDTCTFCANEISALMNALRAMYGLRRVCLLVVSLLLSASTIHLLNLPTEPAAAHLSQGLHDLEAIAVNHQFAARAVEVIRSLSSKWNITLPEGAASVTVYRVPKQPESSVLPPSAFFAASISRHKSTRASFEEPSSAERSPHVSTQHPERQSYPQQVLQQRQQPSQHQDSNQIPTTCTFYTDPSTYIDPTSAQVAFWTPFPAQVMPIGQYGAISVQQQWPMYRGAAGTLQGFGGRQQSAPGRLDDGDLDTNWNWSGFEPPG